MQSVLIANRGEIALRVIRAARELGLRTIAVYSELDRHARHVRAADEAWNIGPAPSKESYLNIERLIGVATDADADAVHPGYGFLAENPDFAQAVLDAGRIWVGPSPHSISMMGDKVASREAATAAGVPPVPGSSGPVDDVAAVARLGAEHGYPLAVKAARGGGGKGLKIVRTEADLEAAFEAARREAAAWFGSPAVFVEKYLDRARHIEAQVLFDQHGQGVFLGERDCSIQRRHQKLIEESPAVDFTAAQRTALGEAALAVAGAAGYANAGTVEFLVIPSGDFYFLEMNTRIQVEHTVTEMVTGIDLVQAQLRIAAGELLPFEATPPLRGHSIEFRINAEDPANGFLPTPGTVVEYREPGGLGVRVDSGIEPGAQISQYYDTLVAKLVVWGRDRDEAIRRSRRALREFHVVGVATTIPAHLEILDSVDFLQGTHHTRWVEQSLDLSRVESPLSHPVLPQDQELEQRDLTVEVGGKRFEVRVWSPAVIVPAGGGAKPAPRRRPPKRTAAAAVGADTEGVVTAPMQGTIVKVHHEAGSTVKADEPLLVLEAMKMENEIRSPEAGEVVEMRVRPGDTVAPGQVLAIVR